MTVRILITMKWKKIQGKCTCIVHAEDCLIAELRTVPPLNRPLCRLDSMVKKFQN